MEQEEETKPEERRRRRRRRRGILAKRMGARGVGHLPHPNSDIDNDKFREFQSLPAQWREERQRQQRNNQSGWMTRGSSKTTGRGAVR